MFVPPNKKALRTRVQQATKAQSGATAARISVRATASSLAARFLTLSAKKSYA
jgi:hypothetical protein